MSTAPGWLRGEGWGWGYQVCQDHLCAGVQVGLQLWSNDQSRVDRDHVKLDAVAGIADKVPCRLLCQRLAGWHNTAGVYVCE